MGTENLYDSLLNIFIDPIMKIIEAFANNHTALNALTFVFNGFMALVFMLWAGRRIKDGDMFDWRTMIPDLSKIIIIAGVANFALLYPTKYYEYFFALINLPQEVIMPFMEKASNVVVGNTPMLSADGRAGLPALVTKIAETIGFIWERMFVEEISLWGGIGRSLIFGLLCLIISLLQFIFLALLIFIIVSTTVEIMIWGALSIPLLPLIFFKETLGAYFQFIKKLVSLSLFKPLLLFVAFLDAYALEFIVHQLPKNADSLTAVDQNTGLNPFLAFLIMFLLTMICTLILQKIPDMINALTGHYNNSTTIAQAGRYMATGASKLLGLGGLGAKSLGGTYQNAGGGVGGGLAMLASFFTGGLGKNQIEKGGQKINETIQDRIKGRKTGVSNTGGGGNK